MILRASAVLSIALALSTSPVLAAQTPSQVPVCVENATLTELRQALLSGRTTATALTRAYLARIAAYDRNGPALNAVRELNPDALAIAARLDAGKPDARLPLWGIPILIKDNIATGDFQHTTAGSLALADARAKRDATVVVQLRRAGAVILGKTNLTEFANILAVNMPSGYSSLGGQVRNPYAPALNEAGIPFVLPGGSSAGA
jgi:amidase